MNGPIFDQVPSRHDQENKETGALGEEKDPAPETGRGKDYTLCIVSSEAEDL